MSLSLWERYKYLQRPLEEQSLPALLQYVNRWTDVQREKFAVATGIMMAQGLAQAGCMLSLTKDHLVKNGETYIELKRMRRMLIDTRLQMSRSRLSR